MNRNEQTIRAVIFDWAGTTVDYGSRAPAGVFVEVFAQWGVAISHTEARGPMGMHKRDHIRTLTQEPAIAQRWNDAHRRHPTEADVEAMFEAFVPRQLACLPDYAELIPGITRTQEALRSRGIKIGSNTGYNREMVEILLAAARPQGYTPDATVCASEVAAGRQAPWMAFRLAEQMGVYPMMSIVKVGDTIADIGEGLNAGMWSVGVAKTGNMIGMSQEEIEALPAQELADRLETARGRMHTAGAHFVVDHVVEVPALIDVINDRLARGEAP